MNVFIMALEPIESRYTCEWFDFLPNRIKSFMEENNVEGNVFNIIGEQRNSIATEGAFLNFIDTNFWKNTQVNEIVSKFASGEIKNGDKFIFTDAWHPGIIQIKYMSSLTGIDVEIHSIWHAGSYDQNDFLGRHFDKSWSYNFERSLFAASTKNYFATKYHSALFKNTLDGFENQIFKEKSVVCGLPFDYLKERIHISNVKKEDIILFPHRISTEKQPEIFRDLAGELPEYEFIICQEKNLSKLEYHELLKRSKMVFSCNLQETLGISCYEGLLAGCVPLVPDRLSYFEMYPDEVKYPSEWTCNQLNYQEYKEQLKSRIRSIMSSYDEFFNENKNKLEESLDKFFNSNKMLINIFND